MKRTLKTLLAITLVLALALTSFGCAKKEETPEKGKTALAIAGIQGPTGVGLANLMETAASSETINYSFTIATSPDEVVGKFSSGEVQIASVPTNLAATLYNKLNGDVQMLAINTAGVLYMLENGNTIQSVNDLRGKTIYSTGEGANPEYVLRHVLAKNGIDPDKDVTIEFLTENTELIQKLAKNEASVAMVPEPAATTVMTKNTALRVALSMDEEWNKVEPNNKMMMGCVIAKKSFVEQNAEVINTFLADYKKSIEATSDVNATAALCAKHGIIAAEPIAKQAIGRCNVVYIDGANMKTTIHGYYEILFAANPKSIGGAMPNDAFYYVAK